MTLRDDFLARFDGSAGPHPLYVPDLTLWYQWHHSRGTLPVEWQNYTLVQIARALGVPQVIVDKAPTADLWAGQTDEGELGFTYAEVDKLLYLLVDERYTPAECIEAGFAEPFVQAVVRRVQRNQFKRVLPPIAKLSNRTVGYDFLYLRDWGT